jgi:hypothetical protein
MSSPFTLHRQLTKHDVKLETEIRQWINEWLERQAVDPAETIHDNLKDGVTLCE